MHGRSHLGAPLGTQDFISGFVSDLVHQWLEELLLLKDGAKSQPHATYVAFTHGFIHKFS